VIPLRFVADVAGVIAAVVATAAEMQHILSQEKNIGKPLVSDGRALRRAPPWKRAGARYGPISFVSIVAETDLQAPSNRTVQAKVQRSSGTRGTRWPPRCRGTLDC
jgi:hypothetical protein